MSPCVSHHSVQSTDVSPSRGRTLAVAVLLAALAGCDGQPQQPSERPSQQPSQQPAQQPSQRPSRQSSEPPQQPSAGFRLADAAFEVGPPEIVMGPSTYVDSPLNAIQVGDTVRAYVGNVETVLLEGAGVADLEPTDRVVVGRGRDETEFDWCGSWLDAVERDLQDPGLLRAWYHAEADCAYTANQTHKSIAYAESRDGGLTFTKPDYPDNQVVRSPYGGASGHHTGRGAPSVVRRDGHFYLYYQDVRPDLSTVTAVARAPVSSGGVPGSWRNYTEGADGRGSWTADALGGPATALETTVPASSVSVHTPSDEVVLVRQHATSGGVVLQVSSDGIHFKALPEPIVPYLASQVRTDWGEVNRQQVIGYTSIVADDGAREWGGSFSLFHLYVFPGGTLRGERYLVRREVTVTEARADQPRSTIALTEYVDPGSGDTFGTSAPMLEEYAAGEVLGFLLGSPGADRRPLFECTSAGGDRFVAAACGTGARTGRLVGYVFKEQQDGTVGLVRCVTDAGDRFTTTAEDCDSRGSSQSELGFVYPPGD